MMIFFTCVFTEGRPILYQKTLKKAKKKQLKASPKILLLAAYWVTKSVFSPVVSQKPKTSCFLSVCFDLELTPFLEIRILKILRRSLLSNMRNTKCMF